MKTIDAAEVAEYWDGNAQVWVDQVRKGNDVFRSVWAKHAAVYFHVKAVKNKKKGEPPLPISAKPGPAPAAGGPD